MISAISGKKQPQGELIVTWQTGPLFRVAAVNEKVRLKFALAYDAKYRNKPQTNRRFDQG